VEFQHCPTQLHNLCACARIVSAELLQTSLDANIAKDAIGIELVATALNRKTMFRCFWHFSVINAPGFLNYQRQNCIIYSHFAPKDFRRGDYATWLFHALAH
jgi:hypothetical protein